MELQTMNEIPIYTIIKIEAEEAEIPMLTFYVKEDSMDEPEEISMEELTAYDRGYVNINTRLDCANPFCRKIP